MTNDLLTKDLPQDVFDHYKATYCGMDDWQREKGSQEGVKGLSTPEAEEGQSQGNKKKKKMATLVDQIKAANKKHMRKDLERKRAHNKLMQKHEFKQMIDEANNHIVGDQQLKGFAHFAQYYGLGTMQVVLAGNYCPTGVMSVDDNDNPKEEKTIFWTEDSDDEEDSDEEEEEHPAMKKQKIGNIQVEEGVGPSPEASPETSPAENLAVTETKMPKTSGQCQWQYQGTTKVLMTGLNEDDEDYESESEDSDTVTQDNA
jgi:hypothetical protein